MLHDSTQTLIRKLCELTDTGFIAWREGDRQSSRFDTEGYTVEVESDPPTVRVIDSKGRELERADAVDLRATPWPDSQTTYADQVIHMAERAHRVARGAERAISKILSSLSAPPQKLTAVEPEPEPCAPDFELAPEPKKRQSVSAAESDAALAAISADMAQTPLVQAADAVEPAPIIIAPPAPQPPPAPVIVAEPVTPPQPVAALSVEAPIAKPVVVEAPARPVSVLAADGSVRPPVKPNGVAPKMFGDIASFAGAPQKPSKPSAAPTPPAAPAAGKVTSSGLLITGIHAVSRQIANERPKANQPTTGGAYNVYKPWA